MVQVTRPEWVMVGVRNDEGVVLFASTTLTSAQLEEELEDYPDNPFEWAPVETVRMYTVTAQMKDFVMLVGPDWPSVFRTLFDQWSPDQDWSLRLLPEKRAIDPAKPVD